MVTYFERLDDAELLHRTRGEPEAFAAFYRRHEETLVVFFMRRTRDPELTADLVAESFAAALRAAGRFRPGPTPAIAWLIGIARNVLRESRRKGQVADAARRKLGMQQVELSDASLERIEAVADAERSEAHWEALLAALPPEQSEAIRARVLDERDYDEIAAQMSTSQAVVRQRVSRGLNQLRRTMEERS